MKPTLTTRQAEPADLPALLALRQEIVEWLASKGLDQWQPDAPGRWTPLGVAVSIAAGTVWVIYDDDQLAATITIDDYADPDFWTEEERAEPALYLHRMMVARRYAGTSLGDDLLMLVDGIARRANVRYLRLDAWKGNRSLHTYYETRGYLCVRTVDVKHRGSGSLFQREVTKVR